MTTSFDPVLAALIFAAGVATGMTLMIYLFSRADLKEADRWRRRG